MRKLFFILLFTISPYQEKGKGSALATTLDGVINPVKKEVKFRTTKVFVMDMNPFQ